MSLSKIRNLTHLACRLTHFMDVSSHRKPSSQREHHARRRTWCCSFVVPPLSPEYPSIPCSKALAHHSKSETLSKLSNSVLNSPQSYKSGLGIVGRILSPGRVSPIDSDPSVDSITRNWARPFCCGRFNT
ncbi:BTB/POZ domain-containing protein [Quillaja saponaria]|uniref:BTB/POZ domain-containing protein n=1 Tax=Quillaja saponaria TaxID=32244 RepID=A0AAD7KT81_QUISA|nr:BTB/POZ domain-containing protein [Quillaja saponaria]